MDQQDRLRNWFCFLVRNGTLIINDSITLQK